jgi:hypothetical protein
MSGWCGSQGSSAYDKSNHICRDDESPKPLSKILMPQLSMPSLCIMSSLLLALVHGLKSLESKYSVFDGNGNGDGSGSCNLSHHPSDHPNHIRSPTTMGFEALLLPLIQSRLLYPTLFLLTLIFLLRLQYNRLQEVIRTTSPVPNVSPVPNAHPLFGHYSLLMNPCQHAFLFKDHATPSGISSMWGPGLKRCASVLLASHARLILRQTSQRDFRCIFPHRAVCPLSSFVFYAAISTN